jgi:endonuclease/exonuclease/phosphatase family metal-dependent hydrolase
MPARIEVFVRRLRRYLNRSQWHIKLLGLSRADPSSDSRGLVLIQIDALSRKELEGALSAGRMPFLKNLIDAQGYKLHSHYSGMPCSTASVQAELFYGVKSGVPAFSFFDRQTRRVFTMFNPRDALEIEQRLEKRGKPLLAGGSAYSDIYSGGAQEAHFCISDLGLGGILRNRYPLSFIILVTFHLYSLIRTGVLLVVEAGLAIIDCIKGLTSGKDLWKELKFVPSRVAMCILLRELITIGAKIDVARGMPIIHLDLMGYHEQSHRRGPKSGFARWTLQGIDDAIRRIWKAAHASVAREYDVWIYSDHGQVDTVPYERKFGRSIQQAVAETFNQSLAFSERHHHTKRIGFLARIGLRKPKFFTKSFPSGQIEVPDQSLVRALGPAGHIYLSKSISPEEKERFAKNLIRLARVPMVVLPSSAVGRDEIRVWTKDNRFSLPEQAREVFDPTAPFFEEMTSDFIAACRQPNVGDIIIYGWQGDGKEYYTFAIENGSHGGFSREETEGFVLVPSDTALFDPRKGYARPSDLRACALELLGHRTKGEGQGTANKKRLVHRPSYPEASRDSTPSGLPSASADATLRIMTYNVHGCLGMDGRLSPRRIARVISQYEPDVVALQELDVERARSGGHDQAMLIAKALGMDHYFHASMGIAEEQFGDAVLSSYPIRLVKKARLAREPRFSSLESRGALWVEIDFHGTLTQIVNTHLGLSRKERLLHVRELLSESWLAEAQRKGPVILCGDFNALPGSKVLNLLQGTLVNVQTEMGKARHRKTWFGRFPIACIDHIFLGPGFEVVKVDIGDSRLARLASDHRPLLAEIKIAGV